MALDLGFRVWVWQSVALQLGSLVVWAWGSGLECREYRRGVYFACDLGVTVGQKPETGQEWQNSKTGSEPTAVVLRCH